MDWLERNVDVRTDPGALVPGARSLILVADRYAPRGDVDPDPGSSAGRIARYARGRDYHRVIKKRLHELADALRVLAPDADFRAFTDTAPVLEREHAARAGLGWVGKHTLLIDPEMGSYLLLGGIATTAHVRTPTIQRTVSDHCGTCTRCIDACPTDAITDHSVDASRCISYLTIEHRERIDPALHAPMGDWLFGCDICQEVCPHNSPRDHDGPAPNEAYWSARRSFDLLEVLGWDEEARRKAFSSSAMKRAKLDMMKRNALIVLGNAIAGGRADQADELRTRINAIAEDASEGELVRQTARDVLDRLVGGP